MHIAPMNETHQPEMKKMNIKYNSIWIYVANGYFCRFALFCLIFDYYFNLWAIAWMTMLNTPNECSLILNIELRIFTWSYCVWSFNWNFASDANYSMLCHFCPIQICTMHMMCPRYIHAHKHANRKKGEKDSAVYVGL